MLLSSLEGLVLGLLAANGPTYGFDLVRASRGRLKRGSAYVTLGRMVDKGFLMSRVDVHPGKGPGRRIYALTPLGRRALKAAHIIHGKA